MDPVTAIFNFLSTPVGQQILKTGIDVGVIAVEDLAKVLGGVINSVVTKHIDKVVLLPQGS